VAVVAPAIRASDPFDPHRLARRALVGGGPYAGDEVENGAQGAQVDFFPARVVRSSAPSILLTPRE
jgi:hypothetical protein